MEFFPILKLLFMLFAALIIFNWIRNTVGPGTLSLVIAAILIYIFVFQLTWITWGIWVMYALLTYGLWSILFWGIPLVFKGKT
ncbi:hypothetical protein K8R43_04075 [archaeon]|nr:hypothetical protein [archaeon]